MWWKLLVGALAIAAIYAPLMASSYHKAKQKREENTSGEKGGEQDADDAPH